MRYQTRGTVDVVGPKRMAVEAAQHAINATDVYSGVGVGASVLVDFGESEYRENAPPEDQFRIYAGSNIHLSGFQHKVHAEQLALFQMFLDYKFNGRVENPEIKRVMVVTDKKDHSLICGDCLQVTRAIASHFGQNPDEIEYWAARPVHEPLEGAVEYDVPWDFRKHTVGELLPETYAEGTMQTNKQED